MVAADYSEFDELRSKALVKLTLTENERFVVVLFVCFFFSFRRRLDVMSINRTSKQEVQTFCFCSLLSHHQGCTLTL